MVCSSGRGRMAVMARLLEAGSFFSQNRADEVSYHKLAAQNIYKELRDADEANLLDEEDMHVFGLKPMSDPLHLVSCNACKKTVKASEYATHAELCRSVSAAGESILDVHGGTGLKKPPRKDRKKSLTAYTNQATPVGVQARSESIDVDDKLSVPVNLKSVNTGNPDHSAYVMPPQAKRSKLKAGKQLPLSADQQTASGVINPFSSKDSHNSRVVPETVLISRMPTDSNGRNKAEINVQCWQAHAVPVPLATKIYYSQRNNRLKSTLTSQYYGASIKELGKGVVIPEIPNNKVMTFEALPERGSSQEQVDDLQHKKLDSSLETPDHIVAQNLEMYVDKSGGCLPATNFSNQFQAGNVPRSTTVGLTSKYLPKGYSYAGNSGKLLGTKQQPNGKVPVV